MAAVVKFIAKKLTID